MLVSHQTKKNLTVVMDCITYSIIFAVSYITADVNAIIIRYEVMGEYKTKD